MIEVVALKPGSGRKSKAEGVRFPWQRTAVLAGDIQDGNRLLVLYRYISWSLTSLFYLLGMPDSPIVFKLGVVVTLLVAGRLAVSLYRQNIDAPVNLRVLVTVETLGIALLLVPTEGLGSPFIWYALNPIFMAAVLLPGVYCWVVLGIFLTSALAGSLLFHGQALLLLTVWGENKLLLLVFLLLTTAAQLTSRLVRQQSEAYRNLADAHLSTERWLRHISSLYQSLEAFSGWENPRHLARLLAFYARELTASRAGFCYLVLDDSSVYWETADPDGHLNDMDRQGEVNTLWQQLKDRSAPIYYLSLTGKGPTARNLSSAPIQSQSAFYGLLGYLLPSQHPSEEDGERAISFLAELGAIALERRKADDLAARLLVAEEQNRIANEIHDGVAQHLFSIVYALHALSHRRADLLDETTRGQLNLIKKTANQAARELRASIYRISPLRRGEQLFVAGISSYLESLSRLNEIEADLQVEGSEESLSPALRKALYRIIREATSNSIRHGKCKRIDVVLKMAPGKMMMQINDDGKGFDNGKPFPRGLGLTNMRNLMASFNGSFALDSTPGNGTRITCVVPAENACLNYSFQGGA